jgi:hypothetical protein
MATNRNKQGRNKRGAGGPCNAGGTPAYGSTARTTGSATIVPARPWTMAFRSTGNVLADCRRIAAAFTAGHFVALLETNRTQEVRKARAHAVQVISAKLQDLLHQALGAEDGAELSRRLADRQLLTQSGGDVEEPTDEMERLILDLSDLLARLKDPCHTSLWKDRRMRIARRPFSGMPLFKQPLTRDRDTPWVRDAASVVWVTVADKDLLEWVEEPFIDATVVDEAEEDHQILIPAPDGSGDITLLQYCRWRGLSRSVIYKLAERTRTVGSVRVPKDDVIPGLYVTAEGRAVVHLETYVRDRIDRRDAPSAIVATDAATAPPADDPSAAHPAVSLGPARPSTPERITRSEELLRYLEATNAPDIEQQRAELAPKIEAERKAQDFILFSIDFIND